MTDFTPEEHDALLVIDVQNDFCEGGALAVADATAVVAPINALMPRFRTVVLTQDWHPAGHSSFASEHPGKSPFDTVTLPYGEQVLWPDHCVQGSAGAAFHPALETDLGQLIVRKGFRSSIDSYSAFRENDHATSTGLGTYLRERGVRRVVCVGLALDYCVFYSAIDGRRENFDVVVLGEACRGIDMAGSVSAARSSMDDAGVTLIG